MARSRRHPASERAWRAHGDTVARVCCATFVTILLLGADCLNLGTDDRASCEEVCALESQCPGLRSEADCLDALCDEDGFRTVGEGDGAVDLAGLSSNDCIREAADCADLMLCSCPDACSRVDECTGDTSATCDSDCETLIEQDPEATYLENRCKMESTCDDLPGCGGVGL